MNLQPSEFIAKTQAPDNTVPVRPRDHIFVRVDASPVDTRQDRPLL